MRGPVNHFRSSRKPTVNFRKSNQKVKRAGLWEPFQMEFFLYYSERLSEKTYQTKQFPLGRDKLCLKKLLKWNKDPAIKPRFVWEIFSIVTTSLDLGTGCLWKFNCLSSVISLTLWGKIIKRTVFEFCVVTVVWRLQDFYSWNYQRNSLWWASELMKALNHQTTALYLNILNKYLILIG